MFVRGVLVPLTAVLALPLDERLPLNEDVASQLPQNRDAITIDPHHAAARHDLTEDAYATSGLPSTEQDHLPPAEQRAVRRDHLHGAGQAQGQHHGLARGGSETSYVEVSSSGDALIRTENLEPLAELPRSGGGVVMGRGGGTEEEVASARLSEEEREPPVEEREEELSSASLVELGTAVAKKKAGERPLK